MKKSMLLLALATAGNFVFAELPKEAVPSKVANESPWWAAPGYWTRRHNDKLGEVRRGTKDYDCVFLGDSITHNWEGWTRKEDVEFTDKLRKESKLKTANNPGKKPLDALLRQYRILNLGIGGDSTQHVLWRLDNGALDGFRTRSVMLMIGTNNGGKAENIAEGIKAIIAKIAEKQPDARVLLLPIFPCGEKPDNPRRLRNNAVNEIIKGFADGKRVVWLDFNQKFLTADGTLPAEMMPDYLHPVEKGYEIWAEAIKPFLAQVRKDAEKSRAAAAQMKTFNPAAVRRCMEDLRKTPGYDYAKHAPALEEMIAKEAETRKALATGAGEDKAIARVDAYRKAMLANPALAFDKLLCVKRTMPSPRRASGYDYGFTGLNAHNHMDLRRTGYRNEIGVLENVQSGEPVFRSFYEPADKTSIVRDLDLDFDASRILFTQHRGFNNLLAVYEIKPQENAQSVIVSPDEDKDIQWWDACYLPNKDQVVMLGTAAYQFLPCEDGNWPMSVLYRKDRKTGEVRQLTYEQDSDYTPNVTHDGRVIFTRWEYSDLAHYFARELMTMNPDGTVQLSLWGTGSYTPTFFSNAHCVPGEPHLLTLFAGGHHARSESGRFILCDPSLARAYPFKYDPPDRSWSPDDDLPLRIPAKTFPKEKTGLVHEFPGYGKDVEGDVCDPFVENQFARGKPYFSYPWPLNRNYYLANVRTEDGGLLGIYLVDTFDNITLIAQLEDGCYTEPIPFAARTRPPVIPDRIDRNSKVCSVHIADIHNGPGLSGVPRGTAKKLRVFSYHYNYHKTGGHSKTGLDRVESGWDVKRILGTVDIEEDGSVCFELPANTPVSFQPLDEKGRALQLMRSWTVGMPGERVSCMGCHEDNRSSVATKMTIADKKFNKGQVQKLSGTDSDGIRPWGFKNEMWPVVQRRCLTCHGDPGKAPLRKADQGGAENKGLRLVMDSAESAYRMLHPYLHRPGPEDEIPVLNPMEYHASTSPLVQILEKGHKGVSLDPQEWRKIYEWIDLNAPFYGKWSPPAFETDRYAVACTNQIERRITLMKRYADVADDPEAEHDAYAAKLAQRKVEPVAPAKVSRPAPVKHSGWPLNFAQSVNLMNGGITEIPNVMTKTVILGGGQSMTFRYIPKGTFVIGSTDGYPDEVQRVVEIKEPFWLSETEVRNDQYNVFDPEHDSRYQDQHGKDHITPGWIGNHRRMPVVRVSWNEAAAFCEWLSKTAGVKASLPTEEQWEWAARAGTGSPFPWGNLDSDFSKYANFADQDVRWSNMGGYKGPGRVRKRLSYKIEQNFPLHEERWKDDWFTINFVARTLPNTWGLYDMHGNAAEWTASDYGNGRKTIRGGSFASRPRDATSSWRWGYEPWQKVYDVGFRVALRAE